MLNVEQLDLSLAVLDEIKQGRQKQEEQWKLSLKQAEDAVKKAQRRYELVDPENRKVAAHLERELNDKLMALDKLHQEFERNRKDSNLELSDAQQQQILDLAQDYPTVWNAPTTTPQQRKGILRLLVQQVSLSPVSDDKYGRQVKILWHTGAVSELYINIRIGRLPETALQLIEELVASGKSHSEIAQELNERGLRGGKEQEFTRNSVGQICSKHKITRRESSYSGSLPEATLQLIKELVTGGMTHCEVAQELNRREFRGVNEQEFTQESVDSICYIKKISKRKKSSLKGLPETTLRLIEELVADGLSNAEIAQELNDRGFRTVKGHKFTRNSVWIITHEMKKRLQEPEVDSNH
ncbi:recombinase family protein [Pantanalinema rosaneae CENA516]|uniref:recombinase family protein n=1 Tax=Pantanalinema rosaneae TaxID=1620701 RepID=UPI003D6FFC32